jgi:hypothetical protein
MKTAFLRALALACVLAPLAGCDIDNRTITSWYEGINPPPAPVADPPTGLYDEGQEVTLTCADELAVIYWAIDEDPGDPPQGGIKYDGTTIQVELGQTLYAYATKGQGYDSKVMKAVYSGFPKLGTPYVKLFGGVDVTNPDAELYAESQLRDGIELVSPSPGADIYYTFTYSTTYGTTPAAPPDPTTPNTKYNPNPKTAKYDLNTRISLADLDSAAGGGPVTAVRIKAIASQVDYTDSDVMVSKTYEIVKHWYKYYDYLLNAHFDNSSVIVPLMMPMAVLSDEGDYYGFELKQQSSSWDYLLPALQIPLSTGGFIPVCSVRVCAFANSDNLPLYFPETSAGGKIQYRMWRSVSITGWHVTGAQTGTAPVISGTPMFEGSGSTFNWLPELFVELR